MAKFITDVFTEDEANVIALGVDCPESLREASRLVEPFDMIEQRNFLKNTQIFDAGDIKAAEVESKIKGVLEKGKVPLILAKEHSVTLDAMRAMPRETRLVVFDAHPDLKDEYEGSKSSHACWLRRLCELIGCKGMAIVGVRSCEEEELEFMENNGMVYFTAKQVKDEPAKVLEVLRDFASGFKIYVSLDMDVFDPSIAPAVKYPEPSGIMYDDFVKLVDALREADIAGVDCIEIRPIESNRITEFLAVKSLFKLFGSLRL